MCVTAELRLFWRLPAHLCSLSIACLIFLAIALCANMHDWLVCAMDVYACACMCVWECVRKREGIGMSSLSCLRGSQSLFKLPSGFQASHLQTGISCSLLLSLHFLSPWAPPTPSPCLPLPAPFVRGPLFCPPPPTLDLLSSLSLPVTFALSCTSENKNCVYHFAHSHSDSQIMVNHMTLQIHFHLEIAKSSDRCFLTIWNRDVTNSVLHKS